MINKFLNWIDSIPTSPLCELTMIFLIIIHPALFLYQLLFFGKFYYSIINALFVEIFVFCFLIIILILKSRKTYEFWDYFGFIVLLLIAGFLAIELKVIFY